MVYSIFIIIIIFLRTVIELMHADIFNMDFGTPLYVFSFPIVIHYDSEINIELNRWLTRGDGF